jgi:NAD(P)-dependent dehydrogenase (short-subunit alcohol dehydrogenase family)
MLDSTEFSGRVAIVTGAGRGMGLAVSRRLAAGGARVVVNDISADAAERAAAAVSADGGDAHSVAADVASRQDVDRLVESALERYGEVHILVNNAGIVRPTLVADMEEDEWDLVVNVNLKSTYLCSRAVLPAMRRGGWGRIVNFSSSAGRSVSTIGGAHYTAAKAGILGFTRHLAKESAGYGITVNSVCPGLIDTEMVRSTLSAADAKAHTDTLPIARMGRPSEVAELVAFLASDRAAYITGASLDINGGGLMI